VRGVATGEHISRRPHAWAVGSKCSLTRHHKASLIALITAIPGFGLVSIPLGIWDVIRREQTR
jgi:hypothetical protein